MSLVSHAHNLDQRDTSIVFDQDYIQTMVTRSGLGQTLVQTNDVFWLILKSTPGPGTLTGVGGYLTYYIPDGVEVQEVGYLTPTPGTTGNTHNPPNFTRVALKGQSIIAIGSGPIAPATTTALIGLRLTNSFGQAEDVVTSAGLHRGTIAGVYADTGIFYSSDPRTAWQSWSNAPATGPLSRLGYPISMVNNRGETIVPITRYDAEQLIAYGRKDVAPVVDPNGRGNTPWGLGNVVAGPESGYAWQFDLNTWLDTSDMKRAVTNVGPWKRIRYPGSQYAMDQAGLISSALGYAGQSANDLGYPLGTEPGEIPLLPGEANAIRISYGMLELGRPEYAAIKVKIVTAPATQCFTMYTDAFGGDAGGEQGGKDHEWRYYDPTTATLSPCTLLSKRASDPLLKPGDTFYYDLVFANNSSLPLPNITLTDTLPAGITFVSSVPAPSSGPSPLVWNLGTVGTNSLSLVRVYVKATSLGTFLNSVVAKSGTNFVAQADETVEVSYKSLLRGEKSVTPTSVAPGGTVTYTLTVHNDGTGPNGVPLVITEYLPFGFTYGSMVSQQINGAPLAPSLLTVNASNPNQPTFTVGTGIQADRTLVLTFTAQVSASEPVGEYCNSFNMTYEGKVISTPPQACVDVGGGQIGDIVFRDWNGNGTQDPGEEGMPNVTVTLLLDADSNGSYETTVGTKVTDSSGVYMFTGLAAGNYRVSVPSPGTDGVPAAYTLTADPDGAPATTNYSKSLATNEVYLAADWGYQPGGAGSIGDQVFEDLNKNGVYDAGEPGISNVTVRLYEDSNGNGAVDSGDVLIATTESLTTNGTYAFTGLATNLSYIVDVDQTDSDLGAYFTAKYGASANVGTSTDPRAVSAGFSAVTNADFGFWRNQPASIGDQVFYDMDRDGVYSNTVDQPLANVTVRLYASDGTTLLATTNTALDGTYAFGGLPAGTYVVKVDTADADIPSYLTASVSQYSGVVLTAGQTDTTRDFPFAGMLSKTVDKSTANPTDTLTFTIKPYYPGSALLTNVTVTDVVPEGTTFASAGQGGTNSPTGTVTWNLGSTTAASNGVKSLGGGAAATITQRGSATKAARNNSSSNTLTIAKPTGVVEGDVMIAQIAYQGNGVTVSLSGWTVIDNALYDDGGKKRRMAVLYRVAGASEPSSYSFTFSANVLFANGAIVAFYNVDTTTGPFDVTPGTIHAPLAASATITAYPITNATSGAAIIMLGASMDGSSGDPANNYSAWSTTSPGSLTELYDYNVDTDDPIGAAWAIKSTTGGTGNGTATFSASKKYAAIMLGLRPAPGAGSYDVTTALSVNRSLVNSGETVVVTLSATATGDAGTVVPGPLTVSGVNGATSTVTAASPSSATLSNATVTFSYTCTVSSATTPGSVTFSATPTDSHGTWANGISPSVLVTPPLTFTATVNNPPGVNVVTNQARLYTNGVLLATSPLTFTAVTGSIGDFVWNDVDGDGTQDTGEPGIAGIRVYVDSNGNGQYDVGETNAVTDSSGLYRMYGFAAGTYPVRYDYSTVPSGYLPTTPVVHSAVLATGTTQYNNADFGLVGPGAASIGDTVWLDANTNGVRDAGETGLTGITVRLYFDANRNGIVDGGEFLLQTTATDTNGTYLFSGLTTNAYVVQVDGASLVPSPYDGASALSNAMSLVYGTNPLAVAITVTNQAYVTADFGYNWTGTIGDYVWWDSNRNQAPDGGELPVTNAFVMLYYDANSNGILDVLYGDVQIAYTTTDTNGYYHFNNLPAGPYLVDVYEDSIAVGGVVPTTPNSVYVNLGAGQTNLTADFGYYMGARVEGNVFWDANRDAIFEGGETGLTNVTVYLTGTDMYGNPVSLTNQTDALGHFVFVAPEGDYTLTYSASSLLALYPALQDPTTVTSYSLHAYAGENMNPMFNFGVDNTGIIGDTVFGDINTNGVQDVGEAGLEGVVVVLYDAATNALGSAITDSLGQYRFPGLADGIYLVEVLTNSLPSGYQLVPSYDPTSPLDGWGTTNILNGNAVLTMDFGYPPVPGQALYTVSGTVFYDANTNGTNNAEAGISNVTVNVAVDTDSDGTNDLFYAVPTAADGTYSVAGIPSNSTVTITVSEGTLPSVGYVGTTTNTLVVSHISANAPNQDFGFVELLGSISGTVVVGTNGNGVADVGELALSNVTVTLRYAGSDGILNTTDDIVATTNTDASGNYTFGSLLPGVYQVVKGTPSGYFDLADADGGNANNITVTLTVGQNVADRDFEVYQPAALGDRVWLDENADGVQDAGEAGIANVTVSLLDTNNAVVATTITDGAGAYLFAGLVPGTYTVRVDTNTLAAGLGVNQTFDPDATTNHQTTVTLVSGQEVVTADFGYDWAPAGDVTGNTGTGAIGDRVWIDANGNGVQDAGEPGMGGVSVALLSDSNGDGVLDTTNTTTTAADGSYIFDGLVAGPYAVVVNAGTAPTGYTATGDPDGTLDNRTTTPILLAPGDVYVNADFGYQPQAGIGATIGDLVWVDANADGAVNGSEYGIAGVSVALIRDSNANGTWDAGEPIIATTMTGSNGLYSFTGVPVSDGAGTDDYLVWVNDAGSVLGGLTPTYDANGVGTANISAVTDLTSAGNLLQDFGYTAAGQAVGLGLIGDTIFLDRNTNGVFEAGEGLEGVAVRLYDTNGVLVGSTVSDENGFYAFGGLSTNDATYVVRVDAGTLPGTAGQLSNTVYPAGGSANESTVTLTGSNAVRLDQDFGYADLTTPNSIVGTVWNDVNANGVLSAGETSRYAGVTVVLCDSNGNVVAVTTTDASGDYSFVGLPDGTYVVDVTDTGKVLEGLWHTTGAADTDNNSQSDPYTVTLTGGQTGNADFGYYGTGAALGNRVWWDMNNDGQQTAGEVGMTYVQVTLKVVYAGGVTNRVVTRTDTNGSYGFGYLLLDEGLPESGAGAPVYTLSATVTQPVYSATLVDVGANVGTNDWVDSDNHSGVTALAVRGMVNVGLQANPTNEPAAASYDFGYKYKPTLARVTGFGAYSRGGAAIVRWQTAEERDTLGFWLERWDGSAYVRVNTALIPGQLFSVEGAVYEQADAGARPGGRYTYRLIEVETSGERRYLGPYTVTVDGATLSFDEWSRSVFGPAQLDPSVTGLEADPDGDGLNNFAEFIAGTQPADAASVLRVNAFEQGAVTVMVGWESQSGRVYRVERASDLRSSFTVLTNGVPATPPYNTYTDRVDETAHGVFYRIRVE